MSNLIMIEINQDLYDAYNQSCIDEANHVLKELAKIPSIAWTVRDFYTYTNTHNMLHDIKSRGEA